MDISIHNGGKKIKSPRIRGKKFSFSKIFLVIVTILTIVYFIMQLSKKKYDMKYTLTLFILFILSVVGYIVIDLKIKHPIFIIVKIGFGLGVPIALLIFNILIGQNKY